MTLKPAVEHVQAGAGRPGGGGSGVELAEDNAQQASPPLAYWRTALSSNGALLAADAHILKTGLQGDPRSLHEVHIYDVVSAKLINRFPIDGRQGLAFSSDSRLLAAGRRAVRQADNERRVQAIEGIHEVTSGRKLAEARHSEVVEPKKNPFIGHIVMLGFLSGDRQLVTSTQETRIWRIDRE